MRLKSVHIRCAGILVLGTVVGCSGVNTGQDPNGDSDVKIVEVIPAVGPLSGGITVEITGEGFVPDNLLVTFGGAPANAPTISESGSIVATLPARSTPGFVDVVVANAQGQATLTDGFEYREGSTMGITGVNPSCGKVSGGDAVEIIGAGFDDGVAPPTVRFGGAAATVTANSATSVSVTTPAGSAGAVAVEVSNQNGTASAPNAFIFDDNCSGSSGGNLSALIDFEYIMSQGDPPVVSGVAYFFPPADLGTPSQGSCVLDPQATITGFNDAGGAVTLTWGGGGNVSLNKTTSQGQPYYDSGSLASGSWSMGDTVDIDVPGGADVQAFSVANAATAPPGEFAVSAMLGAPADFEGGVSLFSATADVSLAWGDQKDGNGDWMVDPLLGGPLSSNVNHVQVIAVLPDLSGINHYLVCEALDSGSFCIKGGLGSQFCQTPGDTLEDLFLAAEGDALGFAFGAIGIIRTDKQTITLPDSSKGQVDVGVSRVTNLDIADLL